MCRTHHAVAFLIMVALSGCATWTPQGLTPRAVIERDRPAQIRVTRRDSSRIELRAPVIQGDSLRGQAGGGEASIALADISYLSLNRGNKAGVAALAGAGVAAGLITLIAATWNR